MAEPISQSPANTSPVRRPSWTLWGALLVLFALLAWDGSRRRAEQFPPKTVHEFDTMRTRARIVILDHPGLAFPPQAAAEAAESAVREVEQLMNPYREGSDLWRLNHAEPGEWVSVHPMTWRVVMEALRLHRLSGGAFDPTVGPLKRLYFPDGKPRGALPDEAERVAAHAKVGAGKLRFEREDMRLSWTVPGMMLDLSALAKGYAVDRAMEVLLARGVRDGMVNIGGELRLAGTVPLGGLSTLEMGVAPAPDVDGGAPGPELGPGVPASDAPTGGGLPKRRPWRLEVMDPRHPDRSPAEREYLSRTNGAVATSGDYEQYFEVDGRRYSHLIDPRSGEPVVAAAAATVVLPGGCVLADALATTLCVLGPEAGKAFMEARADDMLSDGAEAWIYTADADGKVRRTEIVIPGEGLERMRHPTAPPPRKADPEAEREEVAKEARWLDSVLGS